MAHNELCSIWKPPAPHDTCPRIRLDAVIATQWASSHKNELLVHLEHGITIKLDVANGNAFLHDWGKYVDGLLSDD